MFVTLALHNRIKKNVWKQTETYNLLIKLKMDFLACIPVTVVIYQTWQESWKPDSTPHVTFICYKFRQTHTYTHLHPYNKLKQKLQNIPSVLPSHVYTYIYNIRIYSTLIINTMVCLFMLYYISQCNEMKWKIISNYGRFMSNELFCGICFSWNGYGKVK